MSDVICISSSDDEEDTSKKHDKNDKLKKKSNISQKRKISLNLSGEENKNKKHKSDNTNTDNDKHKKNTSTTNTTDTKNKHSNIINGLTKHSENKNSLDKYSPKPGTSKQIDEVENKLSKKTEIDKSPKSRFEFPPGTSQRTPIKKVIRPQLVIKEKVPIPDPSENVFVRFLEACQLKKDDEDTRKIVRNLKKRYDELNPIDRDDEDFRLFLNGSFQKISNSLQDKIYVHMHEVLDELKRRNKKPRLSVPKDKELNTAVANAQSEEIQEIELSEGDMKKVKKLEKAIKKCQIRIKELESQEVNFDDDDDSSYLQEDRYKRKMVELCHLLSEIVGDRMLKKQIYKKQLKRKNIPDEMTGIPSVDEAIISFINSDIKKINELKHIKNHHVVPDYLTVPDYPDILQCISKCNEEKGLDLRKKKMEQLARTAFKSIGRYLKKQRIQESEEYISSFVEIETGDPAAKNPELNEKLQKNKKEGDKKLEEIFKKYVDKQEGLSPEDLEQLSEQDSATEDESEYEDDKQVKNRIKNINSDEENEKEKDLQEEKRKKYEINEHKNNENRKEDKIFKKDKKDHENKRDEFQSQKSKNDHEIKEDVGKINCIRESKSTEDPVTMDKKDQDCTNSIKEQNRDKEKSAFNNDSNKKVSISTDSNIICSTNDISINGETDLPTMLDSDIMNNDLKNNTSDVLPEVVEDDEIEILSDDTEVNGNSESNSALNKEKKEKHITLRNHDDCIVEDTGVVINKKDAIGTVANVRKDDNDNIHLASVSKDDSRTKNTQSKALGISSTTKMTSFLRVDNNNVSQIIVDSKGDKSENDNICESNENVDKLTTNTVDKDSAKAPQIQDSCQSIIKEDNLTVKNDIVESLSSSKNIDKISSGSSLSTIPSTQSSEVMEIVYDIDVSDDAKETTKEVKEAEISQDKNSTNFIKVCSFAKPPDSWKDSSSPEKAKKNLQLPIQQVLQDLAKPAYVDLTKDKESRLPSTSTRFINPLAINKNRLPTKNVVVVKNIINNYNVSLPTDAVRAPKIITSSNVQVVNPQVGKLIKITPKNPNVIVSKISANNHNQRPTSYMTSSLRNPTVAPLQDKKNSSNKPPFIK